MTDADLRRDTSIPFFDIPGCQVYHGQALDMLRSLPDESVQTCVTSPPYWGLRDYGVPGQLGLEATPERYVGAMLEIFREVHRVLRADGTLWLNLGDCYAASGGTGTQGKTGQRADRRHTQTSLKRRVSVPGPAGSGGACLRPKNLTAIPWRMALALQGFAVVAGAELSDWADWLLQARSAPGGGDWELVEMVEQRIRHAAALAALQAEGWYLRSDIIWSKPAPMPESVNDRPTRAHEYIFLLSKSAQYYYDAEAIKEPVSGNAHSRGEGDNPKAVIAEDRSSRIRSKQNESFSRAVTELVSSRNRRTVWTVASSPFPGAHFATFPPDLIRPCILAGAPAGGVVLDPFAGTLTTGAVALEYERQFIGIELNADYIRMGLPRFQAPRLPLLKAPDDETNVQADMFMGSERDTR